ncbi:unnamed protein product [Caenorhabditis angaria]|uniref:Aspartate aminotransferase n=1 Tax=Caenorhabditis angaria TaxID=860376 RepID=A0A9P1I2Q3_9PELO|nr:unnamed protein product [Caenorhabditis angaria]
MVLKSVREAEKQIFDAEMDKEYPPITGYPEYNKLVAELIFGETSEALKSKRIFTTQSISGSGGLRVGAAFLYKYLPKKVMYYPQPTWGNHVPLFTAANFEMRPYRYLDPKTMTIDEIGMLDDIANIPAGCAILLHVSAHNPTGLDPTKEQWKKLSTVIKETGIFPFFDLAYQGFATGDLDEDAWPVRHFVEEGHKMLVAQSFAKNMGLYAERAGSCSLVSDTEESAVRMGTHMRRVVRFMYSVNPVYGARIVIAILSNPQLKAKWMIELKEMANRIRFMRFALRTGLEREGSKRNWEHITNQIGMFCYTGLSEEQVTKLAKDYGIYMLISGRASMAGVNSKNINKLVKSIIEVTS